MKLSQFTLSYGKKVPIKGINYSNQEASVFEVWDLGEDESPPTEEQVRKMWEEIKQKVAVGMGEDTPDDPAWIQAELSPENKERAREDVQKAMALKKVKEAK